MDEDKKKSTLRMIPYGIYVMTAKDVDGNVGARTVNWVTQTSFDPPLVAIGVKIDSELYARVKAAGQFALNLLGKGQQRIAFGFFKPLEVDGNVISGEPVSYGANGAPLLDSAPAAIECVVAEVVELGDHHIVVVLETDLEGFFARGCRIDIESRLAQHLADRATEGSRKFIRRSCQRVGPTKLSLR